MQHSTQEDDHAQEYDDDDDVALSAIDAYEGGEEKHGQDIIPEDHKNVPGWRALESFLTDKMGIHHPRVIEACRTHYNHYLKRFPIHYFTENSLPGLDFALFFPVKMTGP